MATLFHAPHSRASAVAALIDELSAPVAIHQVTIPRMDGSGGPDPDNPHPEKKVPFLVDGAESLRERGAIMLYLTDTYPEAGLGPVHGAPGRGEYLSWLFYYHGVMEPVLLLHYAQLSHPALHAAIRDFDTMVAHLAETLEDRPWLLGNTFSAADLLCSGPFLWFPDFTPDNPAIRDWVRRCGERPSVVRVRERDSRA